MTIQPPQPIQQLHKEKEATTVEVQAEATTEAVLIKKAIRKETTEVMTSMRVAIIREKVGKEVAIVEVGVALEEVEVVDITTIITNTMREMRSPKNRQS
jgi:hypothetical protein